MATAKPDYVDLLKAYESIDRLPKGNLRDEKKTSLRTDVRTLLSDKKVRENFSFTDCAYQTLGHENWNHAKSQGHFDMRRMYEAAGEVGTDAFFDINSQFMYANVYDAYNNDTEFPFSSIIPELKATNSKGEKVPCYTTILNLPLPFRAEHDQFQPLTFADDWIQTPPLLDRGGLLALTEELLFDDKVGNVAGQGKEAGYAMRVTREIDAINCFLDENSAQAGGQIVNYPTGTFPWRHNWKGTAGIASYGANSGAHTFDNLVTGASSALLDWTTVNLAQQKLYALLNPYTSLPINVQAKHLIVPKTLLPTAQRITHATAVRMVTPGYATSANPVQTLGPTPVDVSYQIISSRLLQQRMGNGTASTANWYIGDLSQLAKCMMMFPLEVLEAPSMNPDHLRRRIVKEYRVSHDYCYVVWQPRAMVKSQGS